MEDSETKTAALEKVAELEDELGHVSNGSFIFNCFKIKYRNSISKHKSKLNFILLEMGITLDQFLLLIFYIFCMCDTGMIVTTYNI